MFDKVFVDDIGHVQGYKYFNEYKKKMTRITEVETNVVDVYIRHLRAKLVTDKTPYIETVRGVGYVIRE